MSVTFSLSNFKGFKKLKSIELKPLTVVCGTNNSGKSSLIQSLLLMKQSIVENTYSQEPLIQEPLIFDGLYAHLGSYIDIVHGHSEDKEIQFSWHFLEEKIAEKILKREDSRQVNAEITVAFRKIKTEQNIDKSIISKLVVKDLDKDCSFELILDKNHPISQSYQLKLVNVSLDDLLTRWISEVFSYIFMDSHWEKLYKKILHTTSYPNKVISEVIFQNVEVQFNSNNKIFPDHLLIQDFAVQSQKKLYEIKNLDSKDIGEDIGEFIDTVIAFLESKKQPSETQLSQEKRDFNERYLFDSSFLYHTIVVFLNKLWSNFRYVGPIREAPKRYYMFDDLRNLDIGINGERTPLVLIWEEEATIPDYYRCIYDGKYIKDYELRTENKLLESVNWWLSDVMKLPDISPSAGRGVINQVKLNSWEVEVCLPDVGFGVSQILPILVECLRTRKGETIILEQPEIHLHPSLQSKLADFFICMAKSGKNLVIETHSEHLINRLCLRIAQEELPMVRDLVNILFIGFDENQKSSIAQPIEINDYGEIENWPVGFFDENDSRDLIEATLKKRMSR